MSSNRILFLLGILLLLGIIVQCGPAPDDTLLVWAPVEEPVSDMEDLNPAQVDQEPVLEIEDREPAEADRPEHPLKLTFVDVGQAHALLIQKGSLDILVDAGRHYSRELPKVMGTITDSLDILVITHPHADHYGGAAGILEDHRVAQIVTNGVRRGPPLDNSVPATWATFEEAVEEAGLELDIWAAGKVIELTPHLWIEVLASGGDFDNRNNSRINDDGLVLMLHYGGRKILLAGDLEVAGGKMLINRHCSDKIETCEDQISDCPALKADVFKVPHHGSHHFCKSFFEAVSPSVSVFGAPYDNRQYYHPRLHTLQALVELGSRIKSTNKEGGKNVVLTISPDGAKEWNIDRPEIFVWPEHRADHGLLCRMEAGDDGTVGKECEVYH